MTLFRSAPPIAAVLLAGLTTIGCGGSDGSQVSGSGAATGTGAGANQPDLSVGGSNGTGAGTGNGSGASDCGPNLTGLVRDFRAADEPNGHPDFETYRGSDASEGIVEAMLGADKKPVYASSGAYMGDYGQQTTSQADYDQWYRNTDGVNEAIEFLVPLTAGQGGNSVYDNGAFFPIDGRGFGDYGDSGHNFHFTFELHTEFIYRGGEVFTFTGDDDLWVFVNGHLGIDLGGLHPERSRSIELDEVADDFGLVVGSTYPLDLFHAERHTDASHFRIETSIQFTNCGPIIIPK